MVLAVDFDRFAEEAKARLETTHVFIRATGGGTRATAGDPARSLILVADTPKPPTEAQAALESAGCTVFAGAWASEESEPNGTPPSEVFVAAVAYRSADAKPGVWVDAFGIEPTPQEVLLKLFDEFRESGEVADVAFEEFLRLASPNVVVVRPEQLRFFVEQKQK